MWIRWLAKNAARKVAVEEVRKVRSGPPPDPGPCNILFAVGTAVEAGGIADRLQSRTGRSRDFGFEHRGVLAGRRVSVVETGVGAVSATRSVQAAIRLRQPDWVISTGFAASLSESLPRGHYLMADRVSDTAGNALEVGWQIDRAELQRHPRVHLGTLLTIRDAIPGPDVRPQLAEQFEALGCDMESRAVAEACRREGVRFLAVHLVTDGVDDEVPPEIEHLVQQSTLAGKIGAATRAVIHRPSSVKDMWNRKDEALKAAAALAKFIEGLVDNLPPAEHDSPDDPSAAPVTPTLDEDRGSEGRGRPEDHATSDPDGVADKDS